MTNKIWFFLWKREYTCFDVIDILHHLIWLKVVHVIYINLFPSDKKVSFNPLRMCYQIRINLQIDSLHRLSHKLFIATKIDTCLTISMTRKKENQVCTTIFWLTWIKQFFIITVWLSVKDLKLSIVPVRTREIPPVVQMEPLEKCTTTNFVCTKSHTFLIPQPWLDTVEKCDQN